MTATRRCSRTACGRPAVATLTYVYADQTAVLGPLATYAEPHAYDLCSEHSRAALGPARLGGAAAGDRPVAARSLRRRPARAGQRRPRGRPPDRRRPRRRPTRAGSRETIRRGHLRILSLPRTPHRRTEPPGHALGFRPWLTSTRRPSTPSSRPTTSAAWRPEQIDPPLARATGRAHAQVTGAATVVVGHDMRPTSPALAAAFAEGADRGRRRRGDDRPRLDRPALLRLRPPRAARRDVHREPQPGGVQRDQDVPRRRRPARHGVRARRDPRPGASSRDRCRDRVGRRHRARRARGVRRPPALARPGDRAAGSRSSPTPATGWPGTPRPRSSASSSDAVDAGPDVLRARRHLPEPRGQPDRAREPARPPGPGARPRAPTSGSPSTATPTAASSSTSGARRSRRPR